MTASKERIFDSTASAIVEASAGTGKTYRLVRRYLSIVGTSDPQTGRPWSTPEKVVAVTFTRAAAAKMRGSVVEALLCDPGRLDSDDSVLRDVLEQCSEGSRREIAARISTSPIGTIHGLCASLLGEFPELSGVAPDARPVEPGEESIGLARFVGRFLDGVLDDSGHRLHGDLDALLLEVPLGTVKSELIAISGQYDEPVHRLETKEGVAATRRELVVRQLGPVLDRVAGPVEAAKTAFSERLESAKRAPELARQLEDDLAFLETGPASASPLDCERAIGFLQGLRKLKYGKLTKAAQNEAARDAINEVKRAVESIGSVRGERAWPDGLADSAHDLRIARWARLGRAVRAAYEEHLRRKGLLRYDDLESRALVLLRNPKAKQYLRGRFSHLLVDEFQDTNQRQVDILDALAEACGGLVTFCVGDPKQSIYRFRGAEVAVFERQIEREKARGGYVHLPQTRRPSPELNSFFGWYFSRILPDRAPFGPAAEREISDWAGVPWDPRGMTATRSAAELPGRPVDLLLRHVDPFRNPDEGAFDTNDEAERVAAHLLLVRHEAAEGQKELSWKDVAVLLPKWRHAEGFRSALERRGVPAEIAGGRGLLQLPEARDLINLVRLFADPEDDLAAVGVGRGPCFGLSDLGLYAVARWPGLMRVDAKGRQEPWEEDADATGPRAFPRSPLSSVLRHGALYPAAATKAMVDAGVLERGMAEARERQLCSDAAAMDRGREILDTLLQRVGSCATADLLTEAIVSFRLEACWLASPRGRRAIANAWRFVEVVRGLEADGPSPGDVCRWIDAAGEGAEPEGLIEADADAVTITTVHGAKGLEWKVVVLAGLGGSASGGAPTSSWVCQAVPTLEASRSPVVVPRVQVPGGGFRTSADPLNETCDAMIAPAEAAETKRLLYVAMTRARDRLVLSGNVTRRHGADPDSGEHLPLWRCTRTADYVVAGMELSAKDGSLALTLPEGSAAAPWVRTVGDDELSTAVGARETDGGVRTAAAVPDEEAIRWRAVGRIASRTPSERSAPPPGWRPETIRWSDVDTSVPAVALPERGSFVATRMGDLFHQVMERWNFSGPPPDREACAHVAELHFPGRSAEHGAWVAECVRRLHDSPLGAELGRAAARNSVHHEVALDALFGGTDRITGRLDLLFRGDDGRWSVIDYKVTDKVHTAEQIEEVKKMFKNQLLTYRAVIETWAPGEVGRIGLWLAPLGAALWMEIPEA